MLKNMTKQTLLSRKVSERPGAGAETQSRALRSATLTPSDSLLQSPADTWHPPQRSRGMQSTKNSEVTQTAPRSACGFGAGVPQPVFGTPCPVNMTLFLVAAATAAGLAGFGAFPFIQTDTRTVESAEVLEPQGA